MKNQIFFIVSSPRTGSTSLANICDAATNCICVVEPYSEARVISRNLMDGRVDNVADWIKKTILPKAKKYLKRVSVYGEKDYVYGPMISSLYDVFDCKFVFIKRDGRDVVRSLINQHEQLTGCCYRECVAPGKMVAKALKNHKRYQNNDVCDYSRPRPNKSHFLYEEWPKLTRAEMCAFYWSKVNEIHLDGLAKIPTDRWITVDYSSGGLLDDITNMVSFLGLKGLDKAKVQKMLNMKINSMAYRGAQRGGYPHWENWDESATRRFYRIAGDMMKELGYDGTS